MNIRRINMQDDWERVFAVIDEAITIHDEDFNIIHANRAARKLLNLPGSGELNIKCYRAYHGLDELPSSCPFYRSATFRDATSFETYEPFLDKRLDVRAVPRFDPEDRFIGTVHVVRELPKGGVAYTELIHQEQLLQRAMEIAKMGTWEWDIVTNDVYWTGEIYKIYGYDPVTFHPDYQTVTDAMHPDSLDPFLEAIDAALNRNEPFEMDYKLIRTDGQVRTIHTRGEVVFDGDGRPLKMFGTVYDITDRLEANRRFRESEDRFRSIFENASDGIMIADMKTRMNIEANDAICNMLGYTREELLELNVSDLHPEADVPMVIDVFERQFRGEISLANELPMLRKDGTVIYVDVNSVRMDLGGKECLVGFFRDNTERKKAESALRERERQLSESQRIAHIGSWQHNLTTNSVSWSDELYRIFGLDPEKDAGDFDAFFSSIHPEDQPKLKQAIDETLRTGKHFSIEYRFRLKDGRTKILYAQAELAFDETGTQRILSGTGQDITERKQAENRISESLKEKETLLREIHHRVKNNLAIISSLLRLQYRFSGDSKVKGILEDSRNRLHSMALVHENLYRSESFSSIRVDKYVSGLARHLLDVYTMKRVRLEQDIGDVELDIDQIIPLGLIINELMTNSLKHAFEGDGPYVIDISMHASEGVVTLSYRDSGPGLPEGLDLQDAPSLGLQIVHVLAKQLKGTMALDGTYRSRYMLTFPVKGER